MVARCLAFTHAEWWNCPSYAVDRLEELIPLARPAHVSVQHVVALASSRADREEVVEAAERLGSLGPEHAGARPDTGREQLHADHRVDRRLPDDGL